ncbi:MAG TPA: DNA methyltransferase [Ktedonobacteraceae bacterium]|nr:DNA methyltransferase [Ktedonobacteraceae bacterium]
MATTESAIVISPVPEFHCPESVQTINICDIKNDDRNAPQDVTSLAQSISSIGLIHPILITSEYELVAGARRIAAHRLLGRTKIPARVVTLSEVEATLVRIDENLERNELTVLEKAELLHQRKQIYEAIHPVRKHGGARGNQHTGGKRCQEGVAPFCRDTAAKMGNSETTVRRLVRIAANISLEARDHLRNGGYADNVKELLRLCKIKTPEDQIAIAKILATDTVKSVCQAKIAFQRQRFLAQPCKAPFSSDRYQLFSGDFRELENKVQDNSAQLILSDPPYSYEHLKLFEALSQFAMKKLKNGGSLVAMVGHQYLPRILADLSKHLQYHWTIACVMAGQTARVHSRSVAVGYKPFVWFQKGSYSGRSLRDTIRSGGPDKRYKDQGQSEIPFANLIEYMSNPGDLVIDPFLGGGTTAIAALRTQRRFLGIDIDESMIETTRRRIQELASKI